MTLHGQSFGYLRGRERWDTPLQETDTLHCVHCQALVEVVTRMEGGRARKVHDGWWCGRCAGLSCQQCRVCLPFMRQIEAKHRADAFARAAGLAER